MRRSWRGGGPDDARRGRRGTDRPSTDPLGTDKDEPVDPIDMLAIRADDELLDALGAGRPVSVQGYHGNGGNDLGRRDFGYDAGYADDQQVLAMLRSWRTDVDADSFPELVTVEQATQALRAGARANRPRRRLVPVAAAAAAAVLALSGAAVAVGNAKPGDALWGVSTMVDGQRAQSVEAAYRVNIALATAQQALAQGRVQDAKTALASVQPELGKVSTKDRADLTRRSANLLDTVDDTPEGTPVQTDESGTPTDRDKDRGSRNPSASSSPSQGPTSSKPDPRSSSPNPSNPDPRLRQESGSPTQGNPAQGNPAQGNPGQGNPGQGNPGQGNPGQGNPGQDNSGQGNPAQGNPAQGNPAQGRQGQHPRPSQHPEQGQHPQGSRPQSDGNGDSDKQQGGGRPSGSGHEGQPPHNQPASHQQGKGKGRGKAEGFADPVPSVGQPPATGTFVAEPPGLGPPTATQDVVAPRQGSPGGAPRRTQATTPSASGTRTAEDSATATPKQRDQQAPKHPGQGSAPTT